MTYCECGKAKKEQFPKCFSCFMEERRANNEACDCGRPKRSDKKECKTCFDEKAEENGNICPKCNGYKQPQFPTCYNCAFPQPEI